MLLAIKSLTWKTRHMQCLQSLGFGRKFPRLPQWSQCIEWTTVHSLVNLFLYRLLLGWHPLQNSTSNAVWKAQHQQYESKDALASSCMLGSISITWNTTCKVQDPTFTSNSTTHITSLMLPSKAFTTITLEHMWTPSKHNLFNVEN